MYSGLSSRVTYGVTSRAHDDFVELSQEFTVIHMPHETVALHPGTTAKFSVKADAPVEFTFEAILDFAPKTTANTGFPMSALDAVIVRLLQQIVPVQVNRQSCCPT